jgi:hypothetical protein
MTLIVRPGFQWWDPSLISTALWLDAADSSTITQSSNLITQWNDKSGNARNATVTGGGRPVYTANALNSKAVVTFDGSDYLELTHQWANAAFSMFVVASRTHTATYPGFLAEQNGAANGHLSLGLNIAPGAGNSEIAIHRTGLATSASNLVSGNNTPRIIGYTSNGISSGSVTVTPYMDATAGSANLTLSSLSTNSSSIIGASKAGTADFFTGYIAEMVLLPSNVATNVRQQIEGYLAHKWGLTANLPSTHPYKTNAPAP